MVAGSMAVNTCRRAPAPHAAAPQRLTHRELHAAAAATGTTCWRSHGGRGGRRSHGGGGPRGRRAGSIGRRRCARPARPSPPAAPRRRRERPLVPPPHQHPRPPTRAPEPAAERRAGGAEGGERARLQAGNFRPRVSGAEVPQDLERSRRHRLGRDGSLGHGTGPRPSSLCSRGAGG